MDRIKRIWYLSPMRAAKVQASLRIRAVSPEPSLLANTSSESSGTFRQKARSLAPLNGWACAVKICHDGMLGDTNSLDGAHIAFQLSVGFKTTFEFLFTGLTQASSGNIWWLTISAKLINCEFYMRLHCVWDVYNKSIKKVLKRNIQSEVLQQHIQLKLLNSDSIFCYLMVSSRSVRN